MPSDGPGHGAAVACATSSLHGRCVRRRCSGSLDTTHLPVHSRALLDGRVEDAAVLAAVLPEPLDHILIQADLTAVAPGPLRPDIARELAVLADVESRGGATVHRFTRSIRPPRS